MEKKLLQTVDWNVTFPTPLHFLRRCSVVTASDDRVHSTGKYLLELFVHDVRSLRFPPSVAGAAATYLARRMCGEKVAWTEDARRWCGGRSEADLRGCAALMYKLHRCGPAWSAPLRRVTRKYATPTYAGVSNNATEVTV